MTKHLFLIIGLAGMLTLSAQNLLKNGNFTEKNAGGGISAWEIWPEKLHPAAEVTLDTTISMSGGQSVRITQKRPDLYSRIQQLHVPCKPNTRYIARFHARGQDIHTENRGGARMFIGPYGDLSRPITSFGPGLEQFKRAVPDYWTFDWKLYESEIFSSGESRELGVTLYLASASGTVWFDNVEIYEYTPELQKQRDAARARKLIRDDISRVRKLAPELGCALDALEKKCADFFPSSRDPRTGMPFFPLQRELGVLFSGFLQKQFPGSALLISPVADPLAPQGCYLLPSGKPPVAVTLRGLKGERESFAVNLTNATARDLTVPITLPPESGLVPRLAVHVETDRLNYVDDALPQLRPGKDGRCLVTVPPGMTRQVYFSARLEKTFSGELTIGKKYLKVKMHPLKTALPKELPIRMFSYALLYHNPDLNRRYEDSRNMLTAMHDNTAAPYQFHSPQPVFDENGRIRPEKMDWSKMDRHLAMMAQPANVLLYLPVHSDPHLTIFLGRNKGKSIATYSPEWERRIIAYLRAAVPEFRKRGITYERLFICMRDEPAEKDIDYLIRLAEVIRKADPKLKIYNNFHYALSLKSIARLAGAIDVLVPELEMMTPEKMRILHDSGKEIWVYHVQNRNYPANRMRNYFRRLKCENVTGYSYWCFFDRHPEWEPRGAQSYSVVYDGDPDEWIPSKRSEAIRKGLEDYTVLSILQERNPNLYEQLILPEKVFSSPAEWRKSALDAIE